MRFTYEDRKHNHGCNRDRDEKYDAEHLRRSCEQAERSALVPHMRKIEKARDDRDDLIQPDARLHEIFRELVQNYKKADDRADPKVFILQTMLRSVESR